MKVKSKKDPLLFQGISKKDKYFEGWYFKNVSADLKNIISIIPGISINSKDPHSFIQSILHIQDKDKTSLTSHYHRFSIKDFKYNDNPSSLSIANNVFSRDGLNLDLKNDVYSLKGNLTFSDFKDIKRSNFSPNAMGFFAHFNFLECYHDIVSMNHKLNGYLELNNKIIDFTSGKGYIEKDWGSSFPKGYIWLQSNNFNNTNASIMCLIADIPFLGMSFRGMICNLTIDDKEYRFATYNNSRIEKLSYKGNTLFVTIAKANLRLNIQVENYDSKSLKAPKNGVMDGIIKEGLNGIAEITLSNLADEILFQDIGNPCSLEVVNFLEL